MFIYNVTIKIDWSIHDAWVQWMKQEHIPEVVSTGCFTGSQLVRLLETDEKEGPTYAAQYYAAGKTDYNRYIELHSTTLRQKSFDKWGDKFVAFRSLMQVIE
jgi:Domain of unknown function (DUF4286)